MTKCLVVPKISLEKLSIWKRLEKVNDQISSVVNFQENELEEFFALIDKEKIFLERQGVDGVETKPEWQQIIVIGLIIQGDRFFVYQRGDASSSSKETRLHSKISVGIGGHVEPFDQGLFKAFKRELSEELEFYMDGKEIPLPDKIKTMGIIKSEKDEVGMVHTGLIFIIDLGNPKITVDLKGNENAKNWMTTFEEYQKLLSSNEYEPEDWTILLVEKVTQPILERKISID